MKDFLMMDGTVVNRHLIWESYHGKKTAIKDMDDAYLANLYDYHVHRRAASPLMSENCLFSNRMMLVIKELQEERGLKDEFMARAQIPYKNPKNQWEIWDHNKGPMILERAT